MISLRPLDFVLDFMYCIFRIMYCIFLIINTLYFISGKSIEQEDLYNLEGSPSKLRLPLQRLGNRPAIFLFVGCAIDETTGPEEAWHGSNPYPRSFHGWGNGMATSVYTSELV